MTPIKLMTKCDNCTVVKNCKMYYPIEQPLGNCFKKVVTKMGQDFKNIMNSPKAKEAKRILGILEE